MSIIRIIKENQLFIPIGTQLHFTSFFDKTKNDNQNLWDSVGAYCYQDILGDLHIIKESEIYPKYKDYYVNVIVLNNTKFAVKGEEYWKVFSNKNEARFHKLENNGKDVAICFKPYKDIVHSNTNSIFQPSIQRFKTEQEALDYISSIDKKYIDEQL